MYVSQRFQCNHFSLPGLGIHVSNQKLNTVDTKLSECFSSICCSLYSKYVDLKAVNSLQELPVDLAVNVPSQTPNWDIVSDIVNLTSKTFRSARQVNNFATKARTIHHHNMSLLYVET